VLPGGEGLPKGGVAALAVGLGRRYPFLDAATASRLAQGYGSDAREILGDARSTAALGRDFGLGLSEAELRWLVTREWAYTAEDVLWRRTKLGLRATPAQVHELAAYLAGRDAASDCPHGVAAGPSLSLPGLDPGITGRGPG
jgi:glycerol-3-phosphate dehydrogenase